MNKLMLLAGVAIAALMAAPGGVQADPIALTNDAIVELTDAPGLGKRTNADVNKRWGADVTVINSAAEKLESALSEARGSANPRAIHLLELARGYARTHQHKEARLAAQGALRQLCAGGSGPGCDTAPKYGSYVAP